MTIYDIHDRLRQMTGYNSVYVPEFTFDGYRIDGIIIDIGHRWIRGFEIKIRHQDFKRDTKWTMYTKFCSTLSIVCPEELIQPEEIQKPFGLLWIGEGFVQWKKKPKNFQKRDSLSWLWTYLKVLEVEMARIDQEKSLLQQDIRRYEEEQCYTKSSKSSLKIADTKKMR